MSMVEKLTFKLMDVTRFVHPACSKGLDHRPNQPESNINPCDPVAGFDAPGSSKSGPAVKVQLSSNAQSTPPDIPT
jgi:hypothetical protein